LEIERFAIWGSCFPAGVEDGDPFVGEGTNGGVVALVASTLAFVKGLGPGRVRYGSAGKLMKALAQELRTRVTQVMGEAFAAGPGNGCDAAEGAYRFGVRKACAVASKCRKQAWGHCLTRPRHTAEEVGVRMLLKGGSKNFVILD
jgi:hypothetical protein